jgi:predicted RND superfamily exporter protein
MEGADMTYPNDNQNRRRADDGGLNMSVGIIAAFAIALVAGLAFWTLNDSSRMTAQSTAPSEPSGITTGIAPPAK